MPVSVWLHILHSCHPLPTHLFDLPYSQGYGYISPYAIHTNNSHSYRFIPYLFTSFLLLSLPVAPMPEAYGLKILLSFPIPPAGKTESNQRDFDFTALAITIKWNIVRWIVFVARLIPQTLPNLSTVLHTEVDMNVWRWCMNVIP